jgi:hypothetical protein
MIKNISYDEVLAALVELKCAQYEAHACGRVLLKADKSGVYFLYDEADQRNGDPEQTGEAGIIYSERATRDYDACPYAFDYESGTDSAIPIEDVSGDWVAPADGMLTSPGGWEICISQGETVEEARKYWISETLSTTDFSDLVEEILRSVGDVD